MVRGLVVIAGLMVLLFVGIAVVLVCGGAVFASCDCGFGVWFGLGLGWLGLGWGGVRSLCCGVVLLCLCCLARSVLPEVWFSLALRFGVGLV